jgi:hypothetical protein
MKSDATMTRALTAGVHVRLTAAERERLRTILFNKGSVSLQSFFRQVALQEIREAGEGPQEKMADVGIQE